MERKPGVIRYALLIMLAISFFGCSKTATGPREVKGPDETVVLNLVNVSNKTVGSLFIDNIDGKARARIAMANGYYTPGVNMKANITLNNGQVVYANCQDVNGSDGKCSTFPITVLSDNSDALFQKITTTDGLVFNVMDRNNTVVARSSNYAVVIDN